MTKDQSKQIIEQAINAALLKGVYSLDDIKLIVIAIENAFSIEK